MVRVKLIHFIIMLAVFLGLALAALTQQLGVNWAHRIVYEACQPDAVKYNSFDPYCVRIVRVQHTLDYEYVLMVSKKNDENYGYAMHFPGSYLLQPFITRVAWSSEGVDIYFALNDRLFIPKENFTKGR